MRPSRWACIQPSTTPARNSSRRSIEKWGIPSSWASALAPLTAWAEQQLSSPSPSGSDHSSSVTATASESPGAHEQRRHGAVHAPAHRHQRASGDGCRRRAARGPRTRAPGASRRRPARRRGASPATGPPSSSAIAFAPTLAASSRDVPRSRPTVALPAAIVAPQPLASKPASSITGAVAVAERDRDPDQVSAGGPAGGTGEALRRAYDRVRGAVRDGC